MTRQSAPSRVPPTRPQLTLPISFNNLVCRNRLSLGVRIVIAVFSFLAVAGILLAVTIYRRRRIAQANLAYINTQNQQQGFSGQYPPPPQGSFFGFGGGGQKPQSQNYNEQYTPQYNGQQYGQPGAQYSGQHYPQHNPPQYPPTVYDQGQTQPVSTNLASPFSLLFLTLSSSYRLPRTLATRLPLSAEEPTLPPSPLCNEWKFGFVQLTQYHDLFAVFASSFCTSYTPEFTTILITY